MSNKILENSTNFCLILYDKIETSFEYELGSFASQRNQGLTHRLLNLCVLVIDRLEQGDDKILRIFKSIKLVAKNNSKTE